MDATYRSPDATRIPPAITWPQFETDLGSRELALFLDYDGTLTPIAPRPDLATLSDATRALLARLAGLMTVAVITGRDLTDIRARVGLDQVVYVGSHGFDIAGPGIKGQPEAANAHARDLVAWASAELDKALAGVPGLILEPKRFSAAVHYRLVPDDQVDPILAAVERIAAREAGLRVAKGKKLAELRPVDDWHKGSALFWVLGALGLERADVLPLFFGDDQTDEDGFRALRQAGRGYGIVVCEPPRPSFAHARLSDTEAVTGFLGDIADWAAAGR